MTAKQQELTITVRIDCIDGPRVRDADAICEAIQLDLDGYQFEAQDPDRDDVTVLALDVISVAEAG